MGGHFALHCKGIALQGHWVGSALCWEGIGLGALCVGRASCGVVSIGKSSAAAGLAEGRACKLPILSNPLIAASADAPLYPDALLLDAHTPCRPAGGVAGARARQAAGAHC